MSAQLGFDLLGGSSLLDRFVLELRASIAHDDPMPPGPYSIGLTKCLEPDGHAYLSRPYVILCGDGRSIAGHVESRACAGAIVEALNRAYPA